MDDKLTKLETFCSAMRRLRKAQEEADLQAALSDAESAYEACSDFLDDDDFKRELYQAESRFVTMRLNRFPEERVPRQEVHRREFTVMEENFFQSPLVEEPTMTVDMSFPELLPPKWVDLFGQKDLGEFYLGDYCKQDKNQDGQ